ncbi:hypothetical protein HPB48_027064 [Haemaphysalis longicornis]|uniref:Uncharacterized protein n=1 Tax=Haemaphysalis longicornis TaxID=44386 RepID=A0A9J6HCB4_HAELO|nr:hypothetical protein HPB48_027064 [Haemaphysalis longicornis]
MVLNTFAVLFLVVYYAVLTFLGVWSGRKVNAVSGATRPGGHRDSRLWSRGKLVDDDADAFFLRYFACDRKLSLLVGFTSMTGSTAEVIVELDQVIAIVVSATVTFFYTSLGGLYSVSYTDGFQAFIVTLGLVYFERTQACPSIFIVHMMSYVSAFGVLFLAIPPMIMGAAAKTASESFRGILTHPSPHLFCAVFVSRGWGLP